MPVQANATFIFQSYFVSDGGISLVFLCTDPGPGEESEYTVLVTDAELSAVTTQVQLRNLVDAKLKRKIRSANIASKLDQFIGQSLVI